MRREGRTFAGNLEAALQKIAILRENEANQDGSPPPAGSAASIS
jgi:hypothetical protein